MSILVSSPTVSVSPLPGCPGSPRLGPHGVLVTSGFFDEDGNPNPNPNPVPVPTHRNTNYNSSSFSGSYKKYNLDADAPVPRAVVPEPRRGRRPMSTVYTSLPPGAAEPVLGGIIFDKNQRTESLDDDTLFMPPRSLHLRSNSLSAADVLSFTTTPDDAPPPRRRESPARPRSPFARMSGIFSGAGHHAFSVSNISSIASLRSSCLVSNFFFFFVVLSCVGLVSIAVRGFARVQIFPSPVLFLPETESPFLFGALDGDGSGQRLPQENAEEILCPEWFFCPGDITGGGVRAAVVGPRGQEWMGGRGRRSALRQ